MPRRALGPCLLALLACACARPAPRPAFTAVAGRRVRTVVAKPVVRHDLSAAQISRLPGAIRGSRVQGLTLIRRALSTSQTYSTETGAGVVFAWLDDVDVTITLSPVEIYIPKEYSEASCEYKALLEHEKGHALVGAETAAEAARELERSFAQAPELPTRARPIVANRTGEAGEALKRSVDEILDPVYARFEKELDRRQTERDRPAGYDKLFSGCSAWR